MFNGNFTKDEIKVQALLENKNSPKKWAVIDTSLTDNKFYKFNQLGKFLLYNKNLDYPINFSNNFSLSNEQLVKLPPINTGLLEQEFKYHPKESTDTVFFNFIEKNGINYILSRNSKANEL
jgi:single-stranded DNA-specific DHH superfamily exonuclease